MVKVRSDWRALGACVRYFFFIFTSDACIKNGCSTHLFDANEKCTHQAQASLNEALVNVAGFRVVLVLHLLHLWQPEVPDCII